MLLYSCNSLESTKRLSGSKLPDYSQELPPPFSPLFSHFAIGIYSLNIFCNRCLFPSSILGNLRSEQSCAVSTLLNPRSSFHPELSAELWPYTSTRFLEYPLACLNCMLHSTPTKPNTSSPTPSLPHLAQTCSSCGPFVH